ncbi:hypothetical protein D3OALGB2SA_792 [Olavius algarvensis associated proteobacterium Delta 3]|nr:hypothetical protein D3OALGB2SA_792 [Olavius algarvensis associated proteobacterium Delta 3]
MKRTFSFIGVIVFLIVAVIPATVADPVGTATFITGRVDITRPGAAAEPLDTGDEVYVGDIVRTKTGAKAEIRFVDESIVRLAQQSRVEITEYMVKKDEQRSRLSLFRGKLQSLVKKVAGRAWGRNQPHRFLIQTPTAVCGVRGTDFFTWFANGVTGVVVTEGASEVAAGGDDSRSRIVNAGQTGIVTDALTMPTVQATDPSVLEPLRQETLPSEEEVAATEAEVEVVQAAVRENIAETLQGNQTRDMQTEGTVRVANPPLTVVADTEGVPTAISEDLKLAAVAVIAEAATLVESDPFDLTGSAFLTEATLEGFVVELENGSPEGEFTLSGTLGDDVTAPTVIAKSQLITGGAPDAPTHEPITAIKGALVTALDEQAGAFAGQLGGVSGTWRGLFFSIYAQRPSAEGDRYDAGYLYGDPASSQDPAAIGPGGEFSAAGSLIRSDGLGQIQLSGPDAPVTLADTLYDQFVSGAHAYVPHLADVDVAPWITEGSHASPVNRLVLTNGNLLEVWLETHSGEGSGLYSNPSGESAWSADYGQTDNSTYYILGRVSGTDDKAGSPAAGDTGHVSISGNLGFLDQTHLGNILVEHRGTYTRGYGDSTMLDAGDMTSDVSGYPYNSVTAGAFTKTPLAFNGQATGELAYFDGSRFFTISGPPNLVGLIGGTADTLFSGTPTAVTMMGSNDPHASGNQPLLMYGSGVILDGANGLISGGNDAGNYYGYMVGIWRDATIRASAYALYIDGANTAGILSGAATGSYVAGNPGLNRWRADGSLAATPVESSTVAPGDLSASLLTDQFKGDSGVGRFAGNGTLDVQVSVGDPIRISDQDWGVWNGAFGGHYDGDTDGAWSAALGGELDESHGSTFDPDGYWVGEILGNPWEGTDLSGVYRADAVGDTALYSYTGEILGSHWDTGASGDWQAAGIGTYVMQPLTFNGSWGPASLYSSDGSSYVVEGTAGGKAGFIDRGGHLYDMTAVGPFSYSAGGGSSYLWRSFLSGQETGKTGLLKGFTGGLWRLSAADPDMGALKGDAAFLFITQSGEMGLMTGDAIGTYLETDTVGDDGFFIAESLLAEAPMASTISPSDYYLPTGPVAINYTQAGGNVALAGIMSSELRFQPSSLLFPAQDWGVWESYMFGTGLTEDNWDVSLVRNSPHADQWVEAFGTRDTVTGELSGNAPGAWVDLQHAATGVTGGEVKGTFNPSDWQAVAIGSFIDTHKFMDMLATNKAALEQLNIPTVEIGRANLEMSPESSHSASLTDAYMKNVVFFDYAQSAAQPRIFATDEVGGSYSGCVSPGDYATVSGNGLEARITMDKFEASGGNWGAHVQGGGPYSGTGTMDGQRIWIEGGAAGTVDTATRFSGTAAGVAGIGNNPYIPED